jgi:hypothetical protein
MDIKVVKYTACNLIMDIVKITMQFCGDINWNHIIYDVRQGKSVSNTVCCILIVSTRN